MSGLSANEVRVLHIDDDPIFTEMVVEFLEQKEPTISVQTETQVDEALSTLDQKPIECIVSDYDMPKKTGLDFLGLVRDEYPDLPFILFTGKGSEEIAGRAISAGVTDYLQKGGGTDQYTILANRITNTVRAYRAENEIERTERRYHRLVDTAPIPILLFDENRELVYANDSAERFFHADSYSQLRGRPFTDFLHSDDRDASVERFDKLMSESADMPGREYRIRTLDGEIKNGTVATAHGYYHGDKVAQAMIYE
jgi:PAS domain S-box-containing protein